MNYIILIQNLNVDNYEFFCHIKLTIFWSHVNRNPRWRTRGGVKSNGRVPGGHGGRADPSQGTVGRGGIIEHRWRLRIRRYHVINLSSLLLLRLLAVLQGMWSSSLLNIVWGRSHGCGVRRVGEKCVRGVVIPMTGRRGATAHFYWLLTTRFTRRHCSFAYLLIKLHFNKCLISNI